MRYIKVIISWKLTYVINGRARQTSSLPQLYAFFKISSVYFPEGIKYGIIHIFTKILSSMDINSNKNPSPCLL